MSRSCTFYISSTALANLMGIVLIRWTMCFSLLAQLGRLDISSDIADVIGTVCDLSDRILQFSSNDGARASKSVTYSYDRKNSSCVRNDVTKTYHSYHLLLYFKRRKLLRLCNTLMYDYRHAKWWAIRCAPLCAPTSTFWTTLWFCKSSTQNEEYKSYSELKITYIRFWIEPENVTYVRTWMSLSGESKGSSTIKGTAIT